MAFDPSKLMQSGLAPEEAPAKPPSGTGAQSLQRLQVGAFGLGAMVLLIGLANIILVNAEQNRARSVPEAAPTVAVEPSATPASDPLADAGMVPDLPAEPARPNLEPSLAPGPQSLPPAETDVDPPPARP
ncbi:hypothetical protein FHS61_000166 [Altererythrobacter atlanticus]|uniref:Uncharacterized protein n=1 Tax=Croceibacterium atlanticum TaxID=1267766 RepID=A0A0F7KTE0_9SPHN|nr:hypothetical protein [Croceibacterium atlanticum]AKH42396.1 hypothetical protein WYH_01355 [Croceibacterium atlanticum]MBB5731173.1 hypothetical protein [Croceibacterium atlanticum]